MEPAVRRYLQSIGRRGGQKSRRQLATETARDMVRLREARRAFRRFHTRCFWSTDSDYRRDAERHPMGRRAGHDLRRPGGLGRGGTAMPLTPYQEEVARLLSAHRTFDSYLAGDAAIHLEPQSTRYSNDLDYFHDSVERVATAFTDDARHLAQAGHEVVGRDAACPATSAPRSPQTARARRSNGRTTPRGDSCPRFDTTSSDSSSTRSIWPSTSCWPWRDATRRETFSTSSISIVAPCRWVHCAGRQQARIPGSRRWHCSRFFAGAESTTRRLRATAPHRARRFARAQSAVAGGARPGRRLRAQSAARRSGCLYRPPARLVSWSRSTVRPTRCRISAGQAACCRASSRSAGVEPYGAFGGTASNVT